MQLDEETVYAESSWDHFWNTSDEVSTSIGERAFVTQTEQFTNEVMAKIREKLKVS
jgi:hypothetical protein